jgi:hypothetical protein
MTEHRTFEDRYILDQAPGNCSDCRKAVERVLLKARASSEGNAWVACDQLITGLVRHRCTCAQRGTSA